MKKYRKKPLIVKAGQFIRSHPSWPTGVCVSPQVFKGEPFVHTLSGQVKIEEGDWVVQGPGGDCWPVKDVVFHELYEPVDEPEL